MFTSFKETSGFKKKYRIYERDNSIDRDKVILLIEDDQWDQSPDTFYQSYIQSRHPKMLTSYSLEDFSKMDTFKVPGYNIGFALKPFQDTEEYEVVAVHNNDSRVSKVGSYLAKAALSKKGYYLDHFDGMLSDLYGSAGYKEYDRQPYDPQYDPDESFKNQYGTPDVVYRKHKDAK